MLNLVALSTRALPFLAKNWLSVILVGLLASTQIQLAGARRETRALLAVVNEQKQELADARGTIKQLDQAVKNQKPGETKIVYIPKPEYIQLPAREIPVIVTRTEKTIETKVSDPIVLPPKEIEKIINTAPQSLIFNLEATRDIQKGEKFRVIAAQIAPGVYQPILELGSPVTGTVITVTPVDKIPQQVEARPLFQRGFTAGARTDLASVATDLVYRNLAFNGEYQVRFAAATYNGRPQHWLIWDVRW